jgi:hypothetical protein
MGVGGGGGSQSAGFQIGSYWSPGGAPAGLKNLFFGNSCVASNNNPVLQEPAGTQYQVSAGKTFYLTMIYIGTQSATGAQEIGYADDAAGATNYKTMFALPLVAQSSIGPINVLVTAPATKYLVLKSTGTGSTYVSFQGFEA